MKRHKTVLLADGSEEFRWLVWKCAGEHTYFSMKTVGSGWDVLQCVQKQPPDLLLIDTALPDICGLTVLKELARRGSVPKTIVISSFVSERMAAKALSLGAVHFLPKPFHTEALFDLIYGCSTVIRSTLPCPPACGGEPGCLGRCLSAGKGYPEDGCLPTGRSFDPFERWKWNKAHKYFSSPVG